MQFPQPAEHPPLLSDIPRNVTRLSTGLRWAWRRKLLPTPLLDADALMHRATHAERLEDFGPGDWHAAFVRLVTALSSEAALNPVGQVFAHGQLIKILRDRLRAHALWRQHPEMLDRPIVAPIVVLGSMRSGTTRIQRLLACDPRFSYTRLFESISPVPERARFDLRPSKVAGGVALLRRLNPELAAIHPTSAQMADEEFGLFNFAFNGAQIEAQWHVPGFAEWWQGRNKAPVYAEFKRLLQTIAWSRGPDEARPWVLKAPQFMEELDALLAMFPDAKLLCLDRDPLELAASAASLVWQQRRIQSDVSDRAAVGTEWLHKTVRRKTLAAQSRSRHPHVPQLDVDFAAVSADWRSEMRRVYRFLDLPLTAQVEAAMQSYLDRSTQHLGHRYAPADFGLSQQDVMHALPISRPVAA